MNESERPAEHLFVTSGTTGQPREWWRTDAQLDAELDIVTGQFRIQPDRVLCYAPTYHLYGALFGDLLPRRLRVPVEDLSGDPLLVPSPRPGERLLVVAVPHTWGLISRHVARLWQAAGIQVLHATAALPEVAHDTVRAFEGALSGHEILGTTESGAIAHREVLPDGADELWTFFDDVTAVGPAPPGEPVPLVVSSPRIGRPGRAAAAPSSWATGDVVSFDVSGRFTLHGRGNGLVKRNGRRVHLAAVERRLEELFPGARFDVRQVPDPLRGENYEVSWDPGDTGWTDAAVREALGEFGSPTRVVRDERATGTLP